MDVDVHTDLNGFRGDADGLSVFFDLSFGGNFGERDFVSEGNVFGRLNCKRLARAFDVYLLTGLNVGEDGGDVVVRMHADASAHVETSGSDC
jgi:hypothetical protein